MCQKRAKGGQAQFGGLTSRCAQQRGSWSADRGITNPDIFLRSYLSPARSQKSLAMLSVIEFRKLSNPTLRAAYSSIGGYFVEWPTGRAGGVEVAGAGQAPAVADGDAEALGRPARTG